MDIPRTESSSSFFFHPHKSSSRPIEIPGRHHDPPTSTRPISPELLFDMEPFSPPERPSTHYTSGPLTSSTTDEREPLLYPFPRHSAGPSNADRTALPTPESRSESSSLPPITRKVPPRVHRRTQTVQLKSPSQTPSSLDPTHPIRAVPIHKITGFKPAFAVQAPEPIKKAPREKRLAPPPRSSTFSALPPWHLTGPGDASDNEPRSFELDPNAIDFRQYLLRRIDSQKPLQFHAFQAVMSVSVH